ncbi:unnamed protein product [Adineta steineri]|uniref:vesicle-fusing ATPase n=1 Tax=Adineta steineri TaxID=433720 RepID=A0A815FW28_9BILA|nr:unnamed protein product [Adineta steineri]CAF1330146.1 unnamed protein product [Adineta steineri]
MAGSVNSTDEHRALEAILYRKNRLNRLIIHQAVTNDNSVATLSSNKIAQLGLNSNDVVILIGKKCCETVGIILADAEYTDDRIRVSPIIKNNLRVRAGEVISIQKCTDIAVGKHIYVLPINNVQTIPGNLHEVYLQPYFNEVRRPIRTGDVFTVCVDTRSVHFKVIGTEPSPHCIVTSDTVIHYRGDPIKPEVEVSLDVISYDDIGGVTQQIKQIKEKFDDNDARNRQRSFLLWGEPGTGKTLIPHAMANQMGAQLISINGLEIMSKSTVDANKTFTNAFLEAQAASLAIIFIDEFDALLPIIRQTQNENEQHITDLLLTFLRNVNGRLHRYIMVIAATNRYQSIRPYIFHHTLTNFKKIYIGIHNDTADRLEILAKCTRNMVLTKDVDHVKIANETFGYAGAELALLCSEAALRRIQEEMNVLESQEETKYVETDSLAVAQSNFDFVLDQIKQTSLNRLSRNSN